MIIKKDKVFRLSSIITIFSVSILFLFAANKCEKEEDSISGPQILWATKITTTYSYSGGTLSGFNTYKEFSVINNKSGEIKIKASTGKSEKSCVYNVEPGESYEVVIGTRIINSTGTSELTVSSPNASESFSVNFNDREVTVSSVVVGKT